MNKQTKQAGFTLIEIIAVLIILGILAAVATPKFMSMQKEARIASVKQLKATMQSACVLVYAKANLTGTNANGTLLKANVPELKGDVALQNGYPKTMTALGNAMDEDGYTVTGSTLNLDSRTNCGVTYTPASNPGLMPTFDLIITGC